MKVNKHRHEQWFTLGEFGKNDVGIQLDTEPLVMDCYIKFGRETIKICIKEEVEPL